MDAAWEIIGSIAVWVFVLGAMFGAALLIAAILKGSRV